MFLLAACCLSFEVISWGSLACLARLLVHSEAIVVDSFIHHLLDHQLKHTFCHTLMISGAGAGGLELSGHGWSSGVWWFLIKEITLYFFFFSCSWGH